MLLSPGRCLRIRRASRIGLLACCIALVAGVATAHAATLYAYANGAGGPAGCPVTSPSGSGCSLSRALTLANPADTVKLETPGASGHYVGNWSIGTSGTSAGSPVTIDGSDVDGATLDGNHGSATGCTAPPAAPVCTGPVLTVTNAMHLTLQDLTITNGNNSTTLGAGGGVQNDNGGTVTITRTTFSGNAARDGGAIDNGDGFQTGTASGTLTISDSTFTGNTATVNGGAIDNADFGGSGTVTIGDSTLSGDSSAFNNGDEIELSYSPGGPGVLVVYGSTFGVDAPMPGTEGPDVTVGGGGGSGQAFVAGDVFAGGCDRAPAVWNDLGYNVGADPSCFTSGVTTDIPFARLDLGPLANNGGSTQTMALNPGSQAIGIVPNPTTVTLNGQSVALCPGSDQQGAPRPGAGASVCDAGAYETTQAPSVVAFTPASGITSAPVTITGTNFTGASAVKFGNLAAAAFTVVSATQITARVPTAAVAGKISVTTSYGTGTSSASFTPTLSITSYSPTSGPTGTVVTINGIGFTPSAIVKFGTMTPSAVTFVSATQMKATVPPAALSGTINVANTTGTVRGLGNFIVTLSITGLASASGPSGTTVVTITGVGFTRSATVRFNGIAASAVTFVSSTQLKATVPPTATTGPVTVTNTTAPIGTATSANNYTVGVGALLPHHPHGTHHKKHHGKHHKKHHRKHHVTYH